MHFYAETRRIRINRMGMERGDNTLATWLLSEGAEAFGFEGDGTARVENTRRLWRSEVELSVPAGIVEIPESEFDAAIATREATKPVQPEPQPHPLEAIRAMSQGAAKTNALIDYLRGG